MRLALSIVLHHIVIVINLHNSNFHFSSSPFFIQKIIIKLNIYDHHAAIYLLLLERLRTRSASEDNNISIRTNQTKNLFGTTTKHPSLASQNRRPSSIAEQAMRKMDNSNLLSDCNSQQQIAIPSPDYSDITNLNNAQLAMNPILRIADTKIQDFQPLNIQNLPTPNMTGFNNQRLPLNRFFPQNVEPQPLQHSSKDTGRTSKHVSSFFFFLYKIYFLNSVGQLCLTSC